MLDKFFKYYEKLGRNHQTNKHLTFQSKYQIEKWLKNDVHINAKHSKNYAWIFKGLMVSFKDFRLHQRIGTPEKERKFFNNLMVHAKFYTGEIPKKSCILFNMIC